MVVVDPLYPGSMLEHGTVSGSYGPRESCSSLWVMEADTTFRGPADERDSIGRMSDEGTSNETHGPGSPIEFSDATFEWVSHLDLTTSKPYGLEVNKIQIVDVRPTSYYLGRYDPGVDTVGPKRL